MPTPKGMITAAQAQNLNDNWTNLRSRANDSAAGKPDNRSSWYSFDDLQDFLNIIKGDNPDVNGVRFYLGTETSLIDKKGLTTIFMVPTVEKDGITRDIPGARGMDRGAEGDPPESGYPQ
ncbi:hypothetical protein N7U66_02885 [Lacinutrix neustonica]|uniref:Uncharacterized protein n=1 Tax=Lacinutrix neustonica TaxID=2980107 RepID=A0A9E8SE04_9FLAO|nr:hypothetical protein [Lacinutrix neustonica]WAC02646.1 hypothetical protein N7U66_02885 [Lacinutrix neustonica]